MDVSEQEVVILQKTHQVHVYFVKSVFNGGDLAVKHKKSSSVYKSSCPGSISHCMFVASYTAFPHQMKRICSVYHAVPVYSLY